MIIQDYTDGGCLVQKCHPLTQQGQDLQPLPVPQPPLAGWRVLNQQSILILHERIPIISNGNSSVCINIFPVEKNKATCMHGGYWHSSNTLRRNVVIHIISAKVINRKEGECLTLHRPM